MSITKPRWHTPVFGYNILSYSSSICRRRVLSRCSISRMLHAHVTVRLFSESRSSRIQIRGFTQSSVSSQRQAENDSAFTRVLARRRSQNAGGNDRVSTSFRKSFADLEIELRKSRPYDSFDMSAAKFWKLFREFEDYLEHAVRNALRAPSRKLDNSDAFILDRILRSRWDSEELGKLLKIGFYNRVMGQIFSEAERERQKTLTDCRYPMEWYPRARLTKRVLHLHVGPTNSGKTYQALKRLEAAEVGCYAGPLRLLAQEIYGRMNARGRPTWLVTGDDQQVPSIPYQNDVKHGLTSCTVEMIDFERLYDVAIIDEVQMAADPNRGHAWTAAIVGIPAREVHLCGEERTVPLIQEIARSLGEELIVHRYTRLSPLAVANAPLGNMSRLEKGDCIVCFSVVRIHAMKRYVERMTNKRVAIIYGSLPPEVRAQQARLFNEQGNDYDFLVASDAIGMGLNLAISRIIFDTTRKRTKSGPTALTTPEIRQIGGRAGRYRTAAAENVVANTTAASSPEALSNDTAQSLPVQPPVEEQTKLGMVTAFENSDLSIIRQSMNTDPESITKFGVVPTNDMIELFCSYFPIGIPYSFILARMLEISQVSQRYFFCEMHDSIEIADVIQSVKNLSIAERVKVCFAPVSMTVPGHPELIKEMAQVVANQTGGDLLEIKGLNFDSLDEEIQPNREYLQRLEILHKGLVLYLWMSYRFPGVFIQRPLAIKAKMLVEENIDTCLTSMKYANIDKTRLREQKNAMKTVAASLADIVSPAVERKDANVATTVVTGDAADTKEKDVLHNLQETHQSGEDVVESTIDYPATSHPRNEAHASA